MIPVRPDIRVNTDNNDTVGLYPRTRLYQIAGATGEMTALEADVTDRCVERD